MMASTLSSSSDACSKAAAAELDCQVETSFEVLEHLRDEWDRFVIDVGGDIYLSFDWCRTWWRYYAGRRELVVFVFRAQRRIVGLAPMFIDRVWLGPVWLRIAKIVGSDFGLGLFDPPLQPACAVTACEVLLEKLICCFGCDAVLFNSLSGRSGTSAALRAAAGEKRALLTITADAVRGPHAMFFLPATFDEYLASLSKNHRHNYRRTLKRLSETRTFRMDIIGQGPELDQEFARFQAMHTLQWEADGRLGHFGDWPRAAEFHTSLVRAQAALERVRLIRMIVDEEPMAYYYCYALDGCHHQFLAARAIGAEWDRFGPGRVGQVKTIEAAIAEGITRIEAGPAHYDYKVQLGATELPRGSMVLSSKRPWARFRLRVFQLFASSLHLLYYRVWFMRIAPQLPFRRRPLWKLWIRSRM